MLDFLKKKPKPQLKKQETVEEKSTTTQNSDTPIIDQLLKYPAFELYKPYMETHKSLCETFIHSWETYKARSIIQKMYHTNFISGLIDNYNAYRRSLGLQTIPFDDFEIFLLDALVREAHLTEYPKDLSGHGLVYGNGLDYHMKYGIIGEIYNKFISMRNSYFGSTDKVIMGVMNRLIQQETIKTVHTTYEIQELIDDPTIPNQYNNFMYYNNQLLSDMYHDCMENGLIMKMTFFTFIKNVYKCIIIDHIYRVDRNCVNPIPDEAGYEKKYREAVTSACLQVNPVWFPSDKQTEEIIKLTYKILKYDEEAEKAEETTDDESVPDEWRPVEKSWDDFRKTGLFLLTNQFLHIFGWALTCERDNGHERVYPARVRYRGFDEGSQTRAYEKVQKYMVENAETLYKESDYDEGE